MSAQGRTPFTSTTPSPPDDLERGLSRNPALLVAFHALASAILPMAILPLFWQDTLGLSVTAMLAAHAVFGATIALLEFPSGYVADRIGFKRTLVLGGAIATVSWLGYGLVETYAELIFWDVMLGSGFALLSGADSALLYESLKARGEEQRFAWWFGRMRTIGRLSQAAAALASGVLYAIWPRLPILAMVALWSIMTMVALHFREPEGIARGPKPHVSHVRSLLAFAFLEQRRLRALLLLGMVLALAAFIPQWLLPIYAKDAGVSAEWIGPIWAVANFVFAAGALLSERARTVLGVRGTLALSTALVGATYLGLGSSHAAIGFAFYYLVGFMRGLSMPIIAHEQQKVMPSSDRASLSSLESLLFRGGYMLLCPLVGLAVDAFGQHAVYLAVGAGFVAATAGAALLLRRANDDAPLSGWEPAQAARTVG